MSGHGGRGKCGFNGDEVFEGWFKSRFAGRRVVECDEMFCEYDRNTQIGKRAAVLLTSVRLMKVMHDV